MKTDIKLLPEEKKDLRRLYGSYKNGFNGAAFVNKINELGINKVSIEPLIYSKNQLLFIKDAQDTDYEIDYGYSGRGMYGDCCPAIRCDSHNDITTKAKTQIDSMGKGIVIYAQY